MLVRHRLGRWRPVAVDDLIRLGRDNDGGYVVSRASVTAATTLVAMGINDDWSFEQDCTRLNPRIRVVGVDGSVSAEVFRGLARAAVLRAAGHLARLQRWFMIDRWRESRRWAGLARGFAEFFDGRRHSFHQKFMSDVDTDDRMTWRTLCRLEPAIGSDETVLFVKLDIERDEYRVLPDVLSDADSISGMVIEFHDCDAAWATFAELMDRLQERFAVVHVHGNNYLPLIPGTSCPTVLEYSLVSRALLPADTGPSTARYPRESLDMPNRPECADYVLDFDN
jgi:hypothetical protein